MSLHFSQSLDVTVNLTFVVGSARLDILKFAFGDNLVFPIKINNKNKLLYKIYKMVLTKEFRICMPMTVEEVIKLRIVLLIEMLSFIVSHLRRK